MRALVLTLAAVLAAGPAAAVEDYDACVALIGTDARRAESESANWAAFGGSAPARHCHALALAAIGADTAAVNELLGIAAEEPDLEPKARAAILVQAGEMLVDQGETGTARTVAGQALRLVSGDRDALGLRASAYLAEGDLQSAMHDLDIAIAGGDPTARLLVLRAAAERRMGQLIDARDDASWATEIGPEMAITWLERGRVAARMDDKPTARDAFLRAIGLDREGDLGAAARLALQRMEAGIEE